MGLFEWCLLGLMLLGVMAVVIQSRLGITLPGPSSNKSRSQARLLRFDPRRTLLKQMRRLGADPSAVPAPALQEIIDVKTKAAQRLSETGLSAYANPKQFLLRELGAEAAVISRLLRGERGFAGCEQTLQILEKHGAIAGRSQTGAQFRDPPTQASPMRA